MATSCCNTRPVFSIPEPALSGQISGGSRMVELGASFWVYIEHAATHSTGWLCETEVHVGQTASSCAHPSLDLQMAGKWQCTPRRRTAQRAYAEGRRLDSALLSSCLVIWTRQASASAPPATRSALPLWAAESQVDRAGRSRLPVPRPGHSKQAPMHNSDAQRSVVTRSRSSRRSDSAFLPSYHAIWTGKASASAPLVAHCDCKQQRIKLIGQCAHALLSLDTDKAGKRQWTPGKMRCSWWWTVACHVLRHSFNDARSLFGCSLPLLLVDGGGHDTRHIARPSRCFPLSML